MITKPVLENTHRYKVFLLNHIEKNPGRNFVRGSSMEVSL